MRPVVGVHPIRGMNTLREIRVEREMIGVVRLALYRCYTPVTMTGARLHGQRTVTVPLLARCGVNQPLVSTDYPLTLIKWSGESTIVPIGKTARSVKFFNSMINSNRENESRTAFFLFSFFSFYKRSGIFRIFQVYVDAYEKKKHESTFFLKLYYTIIWIIYKKKFLHWFWWNLNTFQDEDFERFFFMRCSVLIFNIIARDCFYWIYTYTFIIS